LTVVEKMRIFSHMNTVREHREAAGLSRAELAVKSTVSYSTICQLEARAGRDEEPTPGLDTARNLSEALGVAVDVLFPPSAETTPVPQPVATGKA
jgi:transcriptional regulator with XRE-family HTH domain